MSELREAIGHTESRRLRDPFVYRSHDMAVLNAARHWMRLSEGLERAQELRELMDSDLCKPHDDDHLIVDRRLHNVLWTFADEFIEAVKGSPLEEMATRRDAVSDDRWICVAIGQLVREWQAKTGDEWNDPMCFLHDGTRRKGHEECGPYLPVSSSRDGEETE